MRKVSEDIVQILSIGIVCLQVKGNPRHQVAEVGIGVEVSEMTTDQLRLRSILHRQDHFHLKIPDNYGRETFFLTHRHTMSVHGILKELYDGQHQQSFLHKYIIVSEEYEAIVMRALFAQGMPQIQELPWGHMMEAGRAAFLMRRTGDWRSGWFII